MTRSIRVLVVGLALAVTGAFFGAIAGSIVVASVAAVLEGAARLADAQPWLFGASWGAPFGAVLAPFAAFTFLRHAPLWRLFVDTTIGTIVGAVLASFVVPGIGAIVVGGVVGFFVAALLLARRSRKAGAAAPPAPADA